MIVVIVGFMGAGKSTLLKKWRGEFPGEAADLDELIAKDLKINPLELGDWIRANGLKEFRQVETRVLKEALNLDGSLLLSLGGGAFHRENRELMASFKSTHSLWVKTPVEECWRRVKSDSNRPLVGQGEEAFSELYHQRKPDYEQANYLLSGEGDFPSWAEFCKKYKIL